VLLADPDVGLVDIGRKVIGDGKRLLGKQMTHQPVDCGGLMHKNDFLYFSLYQVSILLHPISGRLFDVVGRRLGLTQIEEQYQWLKARLQQIANEAQVLLVLFRGRTAFDPNDDYWIQMFVNFNKSHRKWNNERRLYGLTSFKEEHLLPCTGSQLPQ
jgi:hypothetical protein